MKRWLWCGRTVAIPILCLTVLGCEDGRIDPEFVDEALWNSSVQTNNIVLGSAADQAPAGAIVWYTDEHPLADTLTIYPPLKPNQIDESTFDLTLGNFLSLSICEIDAFGECLEVEQMTAAGCQSANGCVSLQRKRYRVNWSISKALVGKSLEIHFSVAGLDIGYIEVVPTVAKTVPIKFTIANHPRIRGRVLTEQEWLTTEVAVAIRDEFVLDALQITRICFEEEHEATPVAETLNQTFGHNAVSTAQIMKDVEFDVSGIYAMLNSIFLETQDGALSIISQVGFTTPELYAGVPEVLAAKFAPQLRFDKNAGNHETGFPVSAQEYFNNVIEGNRHITYSNKDTSTLTDPNRRPPTYYKAFLFGNQIRVVYWWYYGWQPGCDLGGVTYGDHAGDWEHVIVILSEDASMVAATTFYQHGGWYTRIRPPVGSFELYNEDHPVVYVGKSQHGSYYDQGGGGSGVSTRLSGCLYWQDWRNNGNRDWLWLDTWHNLKSMTKIKGPVPEQDSPIVDGKVGVGDGTTTAFDLDSKFVDELQMVSVSGEVIYPYDYDNPPACEWGPTCSEAWLSNGTGTGGLDQIAFPAPPPAGAIITADWSKRRLERFNVTDNIVGTGDGLRTAFDLDSEYVHSISEVRFDSDVVPYVFEWLSRGTGAGGADQMIFLEPPPEGVIISVDWRKYSYSERWMHEEVPVVNGLVATADGMTRWFDLDSRLVQKTGFAVRIDDTDHQDAAEPYPFISDVRLRGTDMLVLETPPPASATITADWQKADFTWGTISTHPMLKTNPGVGTIPSCYGDDRWSTYGCEYSQCPPGYYPGGDRRCVSDSGNYSFYRRYWTIPQTDQGLISP